MTAVQQAVKANQPAVRHSIRFRLRHHLLALALILSLVAACTPAIVDESRSSVAPDKGASATAEDVTVKIPAGAVDAPGEVAISSSADVASQEATAALGVSVTTSTVSVSLTNTRLVDKATIEWVVPDDWDSALIPVIIWQSGDGGWMWLPTTTTRGQQRIATAQTPHFSSGFLAGYDPAKVAKQVTESLKNFLTGRAGVDQPSCDGEKDLRSSFDVTSDKGDAVKWCAGLEDGKPILKVANNRRTFAQLSLPLGSKVIKGNDWGFSVSSLVRTVGTELTKFSKAFPKDRTIVLLDAGKTVTIELPTDKVGGAEVTSSALGFLLQILVTAVDLFATVSGGAGAKATANGSSVLGLLGDGTGSNSEWAAAAIDCLRQFTDTYGEDLSEPVTAPDEIGRALSFAGTCGMTIGKASVDASGPLGWLVSAVVATVVSVLSIVYSLVEQLVVATREIIDAIADGFGTGGNSNYDIIIRPKPHEQTEEILLNPIGSDGELESRYTLDQQYADNEVDCSYDSGSPVAVTSGTHSCGTVADNTFACWNRPDGSLALWCMYTPWETRVVERTANEINRTAAPEDPMPFGIETADGSRWFYRVGGAWDATPTGTYPIYGCSDCTAESQGNVLVARENGESIDTSESVWTVLMAKSGSDPDSLPAPERVAIAKAWFITNDR